MNTITFTITFELPNAKEAHHLATEARHLTRKLSRSKIERTLIPHVDDRFTHYLRGFTMKTVTDDSEQPQVVNFGGLEPEEWI